MTSWRTDTKSKKNEKCPYCTLKMYCRDHQNPRHQPHRKRIKDPNMLNMLYKEMIESRIQRLSSGNSNSSSETPDGFWGRKLLEKKKAEDKKMKKLVKLHSEKELGKHKGSCYSSSSCSSSSSSSSSEDRDFALSNACKLQYHSKSSKRSRHEKHRKKRRSSSVSRQNSLSPSKKHHSRKNSKHKQRD